MKCDGQRENLRSGNTWRVILPLVLVAVAASGFIAASDADIFLKIHRGIDLFGKVYKEVATNYVDDVDPERFMRSGIDGMLRTLDPYTVYIGENERDEIDLVTQGKYGGVGITIGLRDGVITVIAPIEGFSAAKQGVLPGDRILEIDGTSVVGATLEHVRMLVRGQPGTEVRMKIDRDDEPQPIEFVLLREEIPVRNVSYSGFVEEGIGYIKLERFSRSAGDDVRSAIKELRARGQLNALVLDLRDNPGGLLDIAVDVAAKFLPESSLVVSTRGRRKDSERKYFSTERPLAADIPLAVLVNRSSASASEIVAGAVQDLDRGIIVGTRTFGKGLVQTVTRLSESSSLKMTTARYYTPSGRSIQELDYVHRTKDGGASLVPDSLKREYRTSHNRRVLEAGGIQPDSTVAEDAPSKFYQELMRKALIFKYANRFAARNPKIPDPFEVTEEILADFQAFLREKEFTFQDEAEIKLKELREVATSGAFGKNVTDELIRLEAAIQKEKERVLARHKNEIRQALKAEILGRLRGDRGKIEGMMREDKQLMVAVSLLKDSQKYEQLLGERRREGR